MHNILFLKGHIVEADPKNGCIPIKSPPYPQDPTIKWIAVIRRKGCNFDEKVYNAQNSGYAGALVYNVDSNDLVPMGSGESEYIFANTLINTISYLVSALSVYFKVMALIL